MTGRPDAGRGGTHLILFAHGSADPHWRAPHDALVDRLARDGEAASVRVAFLERMAPSLGDAVAAAAAAGAGRLVILPVFVAAGNHLRHDLPALVAELRRAHRGIAIDVLAPVGEDARFADAVAAIAADALRAVGPKGSGAAPLPGAGGRHQGG
jgi:sirohydrochlorin cobaltochelatase